jgi:Mg/Co/Ni transporter MgtE
MTKSKPQLKIVNCETGEEIIRDLNAEELVQIEAKTAADEAAKIEIEAKTAQRQAILDRLGLNADEAQLLLG